MFTFRPSAPRIAAALTLLALGSCKGDLPDKPAVDAISDSVADSGQNADVTAPEDAGAEDLLEPDTGPTDAIPTDTCPGGVSCPCDANDDCDSALCIPAPTGKVCASSCVDNCEGELSCTPWSGAGGDGVSVCAPRFGWLCDPCTTSSSCNQGVGLGEALCLKHGDDGGFCGVPCSADDGCPAGYSCQEAESTEGSQGKQCLPEAVDGGEEFTLGVCACSAAAISKTLSTACSQSGSVGEDEVSCSGVRKCGAEGLSPCTAPAPQAEVCNKVDDDCDGDIDEGTCDDNNPCTTDACAPESAEANVSGCVFVSKAAGVGCLQGRSVPSQSGGLQRRQRVHIGRL